jgi:hypothetical protein
MLLIMRLWVTLTASRVYGGVGVLKGPARRPFYQLAQLGDLAVSVCSLTGAATTAPLLHVVGAGLECGHTQPSRLLV